MKKILLSIALLVFLMGCKKKEDINREYVSKFNYDENIIKKIKKADNFFDLLQIKTIIPLETRKESIIGSIESIIYLEEEKKIITFDNSLSKNICVFDNNGKFLHNIGANGSGPGEFIQPKCIAYENGRIVVFDGIGKILLYKLDGTFIKEKKINIYIDNMVLWKGDLYAYTNNRFLNKDKDGNSNRVFKIKDCDEIEIGFGIPEENFDFGDGGITVLNNRIVFSGIFDGKIYQILPSNNCYTLSNLGDLSKLDGLRYGNNHLSYILKNIENIDSIIRINTIVGLLFVLRHNVVSIIDDSGEIVVRDLKINDKLPLGYNGICSRLRFEFYNKGIIITSNNVKTLSDSNIPNPSLIIYELKNN